MGVADLKMRMHRFLVQRQRLCVFADREVSYELF